MKKFTGVFIDRQGGEPFSGIKAIIDFSCLNVGYEPKENEIILFNEQKYYYKGNEGIGKSNDRYLYLAPIEEEYLAPIEEEKVEIIVNGKIYFFTKINDNKFSYEEVVDLAFELKCKFDPEFNKDIVYSMTYAYKRGDERKGGILSPGKSVTVESGMIFNCFVTNNA